MANRDNHSMPNPDSKTKVQNSFNFPVVSPLQTLFMSQASIGTTAGRDFPIQAASSASFVMPSGLGDFQNNYDPNNALNVGISSPQFRGSMTNDDWKYETATKLPTDEFFRNGTTTDLDDVDLLVRISFSTFTLDKLLFCTS